MTADQRPARTPSESEIKLVVWGHHPRAVARSVWSRRWLDSYRLRREARIELADTYFDTPDRELSRRGFALRTRRENGRMLVTLKGSPDSHVEVPRRLELEARWSKRLPGTLSRQLRSLGLPIRPLGRVPSDARSALEDLGFVVLLRRETIRLLRAVFVAARPNEVVAHLAVDRVSDHADSHHVRHYELEVEAVDESTTPDVASVASLLERIGGPSLRRFGHSKLAIGLAVRDLAANGSVEELVDEEGYLTPDGWTAIERILQQREVTGEVYRAE
jgi:inorganic triphosphatase YgiF